MKGLVEVKVTGATAVEQAVLELARRLPQRVMAALTEEAELTMTEAKRLCPVMTGALHDSGFVAPPNMVGKDIAVVFGFGGPAVKYALAVHENPRAGKTSGWPPSGPIGYQDIEWRRIKGHNVPIGWQRKRWAKVGQWKYLEQPVLARAAGFAVRVREYVLGNR